MSAQRRPPSVLIVEDEPSVQELMVEYLATRGYLVAKASSLAEAEMSLAGGGIDIVLVSLGLKSWDGLDVVRSALRREPPVPSVVMSGHSKVLDVVTAFKAGARDYLVKPFRLQAVHAALQEALDQWRKARTDARLASTVSLYDFAETVRSQAPLTMLAQQILGRLMDDVRGSTAMVLLEGGDRGLWRPWVLPRDSGVAASVACLDRRELTRLLSSRTAVSLDCLPTTGPGGPWTWCAARALRLDDGGDVRRSVGAVVVLGVPEGGTMDEALQPLARWVTLLENTLSRVQQLERVTGARPSLVEP